MADKDKDFQLVREEALALSRNRDFEDLQNELADREAGRNCRFLNKTDHATRDSKRKRNDERVLLSALEQLLQSDPEYAARYHEVIDLLSRAELATERALQAAEQDLSEAEDALDQMRDSANKLIDGTAVYRDASGNVWTEDGRKVESHELEGIVWKKGAPSYEDILKQKQALEGARRRIEELRRYQIDVLGKHRDRMTDADNPPSKDDLDDIEKEIRERAPESVRLEIMPEQESTTQSPIEKSFDTKGPPL